MRALLGFALAVCLALTARADIPVPTPTQFSLTGLANVPKYSFAYATEEGLDKLQPIKSDEVYRAQKDIRLYVREGNGTPQQFATLKHEYRGLTYVVRVEGVKRGFFGKFEVQHHVENTPPPPFRGNGPVRQPPKPGEPKSGDLRNSPALPYFALAGISLCGLVLMRRRK